MRRREFVAGTLTSLAVQPALAAPATGIIVEVDLNGQTYRYDGTTGVDLGAYSDPQGKFVQDCVRVNQPQSPLSVFIRPDRGSDRLEVVFELGRSWTNEEPKNLGQYRARIIKGSTVLATVNVPAHYWFSRWRWQSAPRPVRATPAQLMDQGLVPRLSDSLHPFTELYRKAETYEPMGLAGLAAYMPTTGERPEIGLVTEPQAQYLCLQNGAALATLLAQAEAAGTEPWNVRDEKTNAPLDLFAYPKVTVYGPKAGQPYIRRAETPVNCDDAHQPNLAYVPFLLTGDPYYLEQMQFMAQYNVLYRPWDYRYRTTQVRGEAWSLRSWATVAKTTPANVPKWLLPQAYWQRLLDTYFDWYTKNFVSGKETVRTVFRTTEEDFGGNNLGFSEHTYIQTWQDEFMAAVMGWMVLMGHSKWKPVFEWKVGSTIARTNGTSGWPRSYCTTIVMAMRSSAAVPWLQNWKQAWDVTAPILKYSVKDPDQLELDESGNYFPYTRGVLVLAKHLEIPGADPCLNWADGQLRRLLAAKKPFPYKWALV